MTAPLIPERGSQDEESAASQDVLPAGIVAGTVLRSARLSAQLSEQQLAALAGVQEQTIRGWEAGSRSLASEVAAELERLEEALRAANADPRLVADLAVAAWCDLLLGTIVAGEDTSCLLADPLAAEDAFRELLVWTAADQPPERHRRYASRPRILLAGGDELTATILELIGSLGRSTNR